MTSGVTTEMPSITPLEQRQILQFVPKILSAEGKTPAGAAVQERVTRGDQQSVARIRQAPEGLPTTLLRCSRGTLLPLNNER
jgi:uncharacterized protein YegL